MVIDDEIKEKTFSFFYYFSRFEFALKNTGYTKGTNGGTVRPDWKRFKEDHEDGYEASDEGKVLIKRAPRKQTIQNNKLVFRELYFEENSTDLCKILDYIQAVRNNLFHGGKSNKDGWVDSARTKELLECSEAVLLELSKLDKKISESFGGNLQNQSTR